MLSLTMLQTKVKKIHLYYFASIKERRGVSEEFLETEAATADDLYDELRNQYGLCIPKGSLKVSINDTLSPWQTRLNTGDCVVFIPPVSGG